MAYIWQGADTRRRRIRMNKDRQRQIRMGLPETAEGRVRFVTIKGSCCVEWSALPRFSFSLPNLLFQPALPTSLAFLFSSHHPHFSSHINLVFPPTHTSLSLFPSSSSVVPHTSYMPFLSSFFHLFILLHLSFHFFLFILSSFLHFTFTQQQPTTAAAIRREGKQEGPNQTKPNQTSCFSKGSLSLPSW